MRGVPGNWVHDNETRHNDVEGSVSKLPWLRGQNNITLQELFRQWTSGLWNTGGNHHPERNPWRGDTEVQRQRKHERRSNHKNRSQKEFLIQKRGKRLLNIKINLNNRRSPGMLDWSDQHLWLEEENQNS